MNLCKYFFKFKISSFINLISLSLKKLIISSDSKVGPSEILQSGKGGYLFKVGSVDKLCYLLRNLNVSSKLVKNKINASYDYVIKNYQKDISITFIKIIENIK